MKFEVGQIYEPLSTIFHLDQGDIILIKVTSCRIFYIYTNKINTNVYNKYINGLDKSHLKLLKYKSTPLYQILEGDQFV